MGDCSPTTQRCSHCRTVKFLADFNRWRYGKLGYTNQCKVCQKIHRDRPEVKARRKVKAHALYIATKPTRLAYTKAWHAAHPDTIKQTKRRYKVKHREKVQADGRAWYKKDYTTNPQKYYAKRKAQRAKRAGAKGNMTPAEWQFRLEEFNQCCAYCLRPFTNTSGEDATQDHMTPLSNGGAHTFDNVIPACRSCNSSKRARSIVEWLRDTQADRDLLAA